jgi:hypothetical protein
MDVINEYTVGESRKVLSYPLKLNREQKAALVHQISEEFWQYQNRYFFINNNCATESTNLIRAALPDHPIAGDAPSMTPKGLRQSLIQADLLDTAPLSAPNALGRYVFPSILESAKQSYDALAAIGLPANIDSLEKYLGLSAVERRATLQEMLKAHRSQAKPIYAHFLELELLCRNRASEIVQKHAADLSQNDDFSDLMRVQEELLPWNLAPQGYGIPTASEMPTSDHLLSLLKSLDSLIDQNMKALKPRLTAETSEYDESSKNVLLMISGYKGQK